MELAGKTNDSDVPSLDESRATYKLGVKICLAYLTHIKASLGPILQALSGGLRTCMSDSRVVNESYLWQLRIGEKVGL